MKYLREIVLVSAAVALVRAVSAQPAQPAPVALPNPSFETGTPDDLGGWVLDKFDGAQAQVSLTTETAHSGAQSLLVQKSNGPGFLLLRTAAPVPISPNTEYRSELYLRVLQRSYGGLVYFVNEELDAAGKVIAVRYSPHHIWLPGYLPDSEYKRMWAQWTSGPEAAAVILRFVILGNPATLALDDVSLVANPAPWQHPGHVGNGEPAYDEQQAAAALRRRTPQPASVQMLRGQPQFVIGGRSFAPLIHNGSFWDPDASRFGGFGRAGIHLQTLAVQLGPQPGSKNGIWNYPQPPDFSYLERLLKKIANADPQAQVIVLVRCDMPRQWGLDHPEETVMDEAGNHIVADGHPKRLGTPESPVEYWPVSYGSPAYQQATVEVLRGLGEWVRSHEAGKLVVGWMIAGGNDGQFFNNGCPQQMLDHSPGNLRGFRLWLAAEYGTVDKLRQAWGDPDVSFDTATMATEAQRRSEGLFHALRGPGRRVVDSVRFDNIAPARAVRLFARALKDSVGRPTFAMTYYPDAVYDQGSNKFALSELLAGDDIDAATAVQEYGQWRKPGGTGGTNASWGVYRLRGKLHVAEIDYRTYLSSMGGFWDDEQLGAALTVEGFRAQVRRDIAASCSRGMGAWFYDMGGIWYDDPPLWEVITEARQIMEWSHRPQAPPPAAPMAVFVDETVGTVIGSQNYDLLNKSTNAPRLPLNLSGVPYDIYFLSDLTNPRLPDYKVYVLLSAYTLTKEQMAALQRKCRQPGKALVLCGLPGGASLDYPDPAKAAQELSGLPGWEHLPAGTSFTAVRGNPDSDPLLKDTPEALSYGGSAPTNWLVWRNPQAKTLATFTATGAPALNVLRGPRGLFAYLPVPGGFTPELLRNLAREVGAGPLGTPNQATYVGCGVAAVHHIVPGEAAVHFEGKVDLLDPATRRVLQSGVSEWPASGELLTTSLVYYQAGR